MKDIKRIVSRNVKGLLRLCVTIFGCLSTISGNRILAALLKLGAFPSNFQTYKVRTLWKSGVEKVPVTSPAVLFSDKTCNRKMTFSFQKIFESNKDPSVQWVHVKQRLIGCSSFIWQFPRHPSCFSLAAEERQNYGTVYKPIFTMEQLCYPKEQLPSLIT